MMTLIAAAALAAQVPAAPASPMLMMPMGKAGEHKAMDCCKNCCDQMSKMHDGEAAGHAGQKGR